MLPLCNTKNPDSMKDLEPISRLPILSKIVEKVLVWQIKEYTNVKGILKEVQSGFCKN